MILHYILSDREYKMHLDTKSVTKKMIILEFK